jgi:hypothetical protein
LVSSVSSGATQQQAMYGSVTVAEVAFGAQSGRRPPNSPVAELNGVEPGKAVRGTFRVDGRELGWRPHKTRLVGIDCRGR